LQRRARQPEKQIVDNLADEAWRSALETFNARAVVSSATAVTSRKELFSKLHECRGAFRAANLQASTEQCQQLLHKLSNKHLGDSTLMGTSASGSPRESAMAEESPSETASAAIAGWEAVKGEYSRLAPGPAKDQVWGAWTYQTFEQCMATLALQAEKQLDEKAADMDRVFANMENDNAAMRGRAQVLATQLHKETAQGASMRAKLAVTGADLSVREKEVSKHKAELRKVNSQGGGGDMESLEKEVARLKAQVASLKKQVKRARDNIDPGMAGPCAPAGIFGFLLNC